MQFSDEKAIEELVNADHRYSRSAYEFVCEALDFTFKTQKKNTGRKPRHISGTEFLEGIRLYALEEYGPLAYTVLQEWNLKSCTDLGEVVYNLVHKGILRTSDKDMREDFQNGFDFEEAFKRPFAPPSVS